MRGTPAAYCEAGATMERRQQLKIVGGIVALGVMAALPFARQPKPVSDVLAPTTHAPLVQSVPLHLTAESAPSPAIGLRDNEPGPIAPPTLVLGESSGSSRLEDQG